MTCKFVDSILHTEAHSDGHSTFNSSRLSALEPLFISIPTFWLSILEGRRASQFGQKFVLQAFDLPKHYTGHAYTFCILTLIRFLKITLY